MTTPNTTDRMEEARRLAAECVERPYNKGTVERAAKVIATALSASEAKGRQEEREKVEAAREFVKRHPALTLIDLAEFEAFLKVPEVVGAAIDRLSNEASQ